LCNSKGKRPIACKSIFFPHYVSATQNPNTTKEAIAIKEIKTWTRKAIAKIE